MSKLKIPEPDLQITFYHRLHEIRGTFLMEALRSTVSELQITEIDKQLAEFVSKSALTRVGSWGLRGELIFPVPCLLEANPFLLGYYRLLLGFSQKQFYGDRYGFACFKAMEENGRINADNAPFIETLCNVLCDSAETLLQNVEHLSQQTIHELTLLTLGPQLRGSALKISIQRVLRTDMRTRRNGIGCNERP